MKVAGGLPKLTEAEKCLQDVSLAAQILKGLQADVSRSLVLCFGKVDAALEASKQLNNQVLALDDLPDEAPSSALLIIAPSQQQVCSLNLTESS